MKKLRIAFGHQARVGKDTACLLLKQKYGGNIYNFSNSLYTILNFAQETCGFPVEKDPTFLQWVGTEWARKKDPNVWVNLTMKKIDWNQNSYISDLRFPNEFYKLIDNDFTCIRIIRPDRPIDRNINHKSETALDDFNWHYTIINNGDINHLSFQLDIIIKDILNKNTWDIKN
jgi:hypothetical protein